MITLSNSLQIFLTCIISHDFAVSQATSEVVGGKIKSIHRLKLIWGVITITVQSQSKIEICALYSIAHQKAVICSEGMQSF